MCFEEGNVHLSTILHVGSTRGCKAGTEELLTGQHEKHSDGGLIKSEDEGFAWQSLSLPHSYLSGCI